MVPFWTVGHAVATGNTFIIKPSEKVPLTMLRMMAIFKEAGFPDGVVNLVNGTSEGAVVIWYRDLI
jgi:malonate-semialdehyde dehydrogenase (acetylating)/methylmalonate-semialdehyde dehydrogenase